MPPAAGSPRPSRAADLGVTRLAAALSAALLAAAGVAGAALHDPEADAVEVEVVTVTAGGPGSLPVVVLKEKAGSRALPVYVGPAEAQAIWDRLHKVRHPRPMTHDLAKELVLAAGAEFERAVVTRVEKGTYFAVIRLRRDGKSVRVDSRPSDAIALALRFERPVLVARRLLKSGSAIDLSRSPEPVRFAGLTLQDLTPELARRLGLKGESGVLVADVQEGRFSGRLRRGDVLRAINGKAVASLLEAARILGETDGKSAVTVRLLRAGRESTVRVPPERGR